MRTFAAEKLRPSGRTTITMKTLKDYIGIILISIGVLALAALHLTGVTFINWLLMLPLVLIVVGTALHVWRQRR